MTELSKDTKQKYITFFLEKGVLLMRGNSNLILNQKHTEEKVPNNCFKQYSHHLNSSFDVNFSRLRQKLWNNEEVRLRGSAKESQTIS